MKIAVIIIAILGSLCAGFLGLTWVSDAAAQSAKVKEMQQLSADFKELGSSAGIDTSTSSALIESTLAKIRSLVRAGWLLILGGLASGVTSVMLFLGKIGLRPAAITMVASSILPAILAPISLVFSFLLLVAGVMGFLVKPASPTT